MMKRSVFQSICRGLLIAGFCTQAAEADLSDNLIAYYPFDDGNGEVIDEQTGKSNDAELFNFDFEGDSNWVDGQIGGALSYDGIDDYAIAFDMPLAETALSVSIWGYANDAPLWASLVKNWGQSLVGQFHFGLGPGDADTLNVFITTGDGSAFNAGTDVDPIELETWEHYAFVADPVEELVTLYRNGEAVDEQPYDGTFTQSPNSNSIGIGVKTANSGDIADPGGCCPGYWDGILDDLGIWHRALSAAEIRDIYTRGMAGEGILAGKRVPGDFDGNGLLDATDIDLLSAEVRAGSNRLSFDVTGDGAVNEQDRFFWIEALKNTYLGDSNLDGEFNTGDLLAVFTAGEFEDDLVGNSTWATGDWNGDTEFGTGDLIAAFVADGFEKGPRLPAKAVPEPTSLLLLCLLPASLLIRRHRQSA